MDAASYGLGQVQHRSMDWEGLCAYERMVFAGAVAVGSGADDTAMWWIGGLRSMGMYRGGRRRGRAVRRRCTG